MNVHLESNRTVTQAFLDTLVSLFIIIFELLKMIFVTGLFIYHNRLVITNLTTKEELGEFYDTIYGNPYKRLHCDESIKDAFFPRVPTPCLLEYMEEQEDNKETGKQIEEKTVELPAKQPDDNDDKGSSNNNLIENLKQNGNGNVKAGSGTTTQINEIKLEFQEKNTTPNVSPWNNSNNLKPVPGQESLKDFNSNSTNKNEVPLIKKNEFMECHENLSPQKLHQYSSVKHEIINQIDIIEEESSKPSKRTIEEEKVVETKPEKFKHKLKRKVKTEPTISKEEMNKEENYHTKY